MSLIHIMYVFIYIFVSRNLVIVTHWVIEDCRTYVKQDTLFSVQWLFSVQ